MRLPLSVHSQLKKKIVYTHKKPNNTHCFTATVKTQAKGHCIKLTSHNSFTTIQCPMSLTTPTRTEYYASDYNVSKYTLHDIYKYIVLNSVVVVNQGNCTNKVKYALKKWIAGIIVKIEVKLWNRAITSFMIVKLINIRYSG